MNDEVTLQVEFAEAAKKAAESMLSYMPNLLGALGLLILGWVIALLARSAIRKGGHALNRVFDSAFQVSLLRGVRLSEQVLDFVSKTTYWMIILVFLTAAADTAKLEIFTQWLDDVVAYLPTLVAGGLIILAGFLVSVLTREFVSTTAEAAAVQEPRLYGVIAQVMVLTAAVLVGVAQIGIDVTFLVAIVSIAFAAVLGGLSLAFALGARDTVGDMLAMRLMPENIRLGQMVRLVDGGGEGEVVEFTSTAVVLRTADGQMNVPAHMFVEKCSIVLEEGGRDD
jgi:hypothetical protein